MLLRKVMCQSDYARARWGTLTLGINYLGITRGRHTFEQSTAGVDGRAEQFCARPLSPPSNVWLPQ